MATNRRIRRLWPEERPERVVQYVFLGVLAVWLGWVGFDILMRR